MKPKVKNSKLPSKSTIMQKEMKRKRSFLSSLIVTMALTVPGFAFSQSCGNCAITISSSSGTLSGASYTLTSGQTLCIDNTGKFTGVVILAGGTVCNSGSFKPEMLAFISGTFKNNATAEFSQSVNLEAGQEIICEANSVLNIGDMDVNGGTLTLKGTANINSLGFNAGAITNSGTINCNNITGNKSSINNTGTINQH